MDQMLQLFELASLPYMQKNKKMLIIFFVLVAMLINYFVGLKAVSLKPIPDISMEGNDT